MSVLTIIAYLLVTAFGAIFVAIDEDGAEYTITAVSLKRVGRIPDTWSITYKVSSKTDTEYRNFVFMPIKNIYMTMRAAYNIDSNGLDSSQWRAVTPNTISESLADAMMNILVKVYGKEERVHDFRSSAFRERWAKYTTQYKLTEDGIFSRPEKLDSSIYGVWAIYIPSNEVDAQSRYDDYRVVECWTRYEIDIKNKYIRPRSQILKDINGYSIGPSIGLTEQAPIAPDTRGEAIYMYVKKSIQSKKPR